MYVRVHASAYVCMHLCVCVYIHIRVRVRVRMRVRVRIHMHTRMRANHTHDLLSVGVFGSNCITLPSFLLLSTYDFSQRFMRRLPRSSQLLA